MKTCKLCKKEKLASLTFCDSLCKEVYQWVEAKRPREEEIQTKRIDFTKLVNDDVNLEILYRIPLNRLSSRCVVNKYLKSICEEKVFRRLYVRRNKDKIWDMLESTLDEAKYKTFFSWAAITITIIGKTDRFLVRLNTMFNNWVVFDPPNINNFIEYVPKALKLELWKNSVPEQPSVLKSVVLNLWPEGIRLLLTSSKDRPSTFDIDYGFSIIVGYIEESRNNVDFKIYKERGTMSLLAFLETKQVTFSFSGIEVLAALALLGMSNILSLSLDTAKDISVQVALRDVIQRRKLLKNAIDSGDEWTFIELLNRKDYNFLIPLTRSLIAASIKPNFFIAMQQMVRDVPQIVDLQNNAVRYIDNCIYYDNPGMGIYFLKLKTFPSLSNDDRLYLKNDIIKKRKELLDMNLYEARGPVYEKKIAKANVYKMLLEKINDQ